MLRLRNLFGPGAKADILTHFLTRSKMHFSAADLVEIGYSKRSLMTALNHLAASGLLTATNVRNKKNYELSKSKNCKWSLASCRKSLPLGIKYLLAIVEIRSVIQEIQNSSEMTKGVISAIV